MTHAVLRPPILTRPQPGAILELLKPITWFAPMWAFLCGMISSGVTLSGRGTTIALGLILAGPLVCGMSQAINDWHDRFVDAINEPDRPIPSGRVPGRWGLYVAGVWTLMSLAVGATLGPWVFGATLFALLLAWAYSAPPLRLKRNGWLGNTAVALCYEGVAWFAGAAALLAAFPDKRIVALAFLYSFGAHGIMTLNDFKSVEGDRRMGLRSLPVMLGVDRAAQVACAMMAAPQGVTVVLLAAWGKPWHALSVAALLIVQGALMSHYLLNRVGLLKHPYRNAALYNSTGTTLYVAGMMISAFAIGAVLAAGR